MTSASPKESLYGDPRASEKVKMTDSDRDHLISELISAVTTLQDKVRFLENFIEENEVANWAVINEYPWLGDDPLKWLAAWRLSKIRDDPSLDMTDCFPSRREMMSILKSSEHNSRREAERNLAVKPPKTLSQIYEKDLPK